MITGAILAMTGAIDKLNEIYEERKKYRYHLFSYRDWEGAGGINDYQSAFPTLEAAFAGLGDNYEEANIAELVDGILTKVADLEKEEIVDNADETFRDTRIFWQLTDGNRKVMEAYRERYVPPPPITDKDMIVTGGGGIGHWERINDDV